MEERPGKAGGKFMTVVIITVAVTMAIMFVLAAKMRSDVNERGGCLECGLPVPMFRRPSSFRQFLWGGWTCSNCGTEMDRQGRLPAPKRSEVR